MRKNVLYLVIGLLGVIAVMLFATVIGKNGNNNDKNAKPTDAENYDRNQKGPFQYLEITGSPIPTCSEVVPAEVLEFLEADKNVIPDKYNTGADVEKITMRVAGTDVDQLKKQYGLPFKAQGSSLVLNFHGGGDASDVVTIENIDFSDLSFVVYNQKLCKNNIEIVFKNCIFSSFGMSDSNEMVKYSFYRCSFSSLNGSNIYAQNCYIGGGQSDGIRAFRNVEIVNCYVADKSQPYGQTSVGNHVDGIQIYGAKDSTCGNIHLRNCRFEIPALKNATAPINACLMLQIEFSDAFDISFSDCRINGGGYSIYAWVKKGGYKIYNASFTNIDIGCLHSYGNIYPKIDDSITFENVGDAQHAYISSVWTKDGKTHIIASNDTSDFKTIVVFTDKGKSLISLKACPKHDETTEDMAFADFPFDIDTVLDYEAKWVVCYEYANNEMFLIRQYNPEGVMLVMAEDGSVAEYNKK